MCLAFILVFPTNLFAMGLDNTKSKKYNASASIMGLAQTDNTGQSDDKITDQTLLETEITSKETDKYLIEKYARLSKTTGQVEYLIKVHPKDEESKDKITTSFAISKNTDLEDLKIEKVSQIHSDKTQAEIKYQEQRPSILYNNDAFETLGVTTDKADLVYYLSAKLSEEAIGKIDEKTPTMDLDINIAEAGANLYQDRYALSIDKMEVVGEDGEDTIETLKEKENPTHQVSAIYKEGSSNLLGENPGEITWTDFIHAEDDKEFTTDIKLDEAQDASDAQIKVEFYQANDKGYTLKEDFTKEIPFTESLKLQIPLGFVAKVELTTKVTENKKEYSLNQTKIPNPIYKEEKTEEKSEEVDADPLPEERSEESKGTSEEKIIPIDPETNEAVIDHSLVSEDDTEETKSAINLNRDSVINNFKNNDKLNPLVEITINNISSLFNSYNNDEMTYEEFLANLKTQAKDLSKEDFAEIVQGLIAGLNQETYKVANIDEDQLLAEVYGKEEAEEAKPATEEAPVTETKESDTEETSNAENGNIKTETTEDFRTPEDKIKDKALESFDESLNQAKEASKKPQEDDRSLIDNISEGIKGIFGQSNLQKADQELKAALEAGKSLEEVQALLLDLGKKYQLNSKDEAKLMADNEDAIKGLIARDADQNFRPSMLMAKNGENPLDSKKFIIRTRFDTSTALGNIQAGQYFKIKLDDKLTVKDGSSLNPIVYKGKTIAKPRYNQRENAIYYDITEDITEDLNFPLSIPVDYNTSKIPQGQSFEIINKVSGLGVTAPKALVPVIVNENGDETGILEKGRDDVVKIIDGYGGQDYKFDMDLYGEPVIEDGQMQGVNWTLDVDSTKDLLELGYKLNITTVKGSGLGDIQKVKLNGKDLVLVDNSIKGSLGIVDSKHHDLKENSQSLSYTFYTPITNKQGSYMIDASVFLKNRNKKGAVRLVIDEGYPLNKVQDATPTRVGMNNRTTIQGQFLSDNTAQWTITDGVCSGDNDNNGLPLESRSLEGNQTINTGKSAVYGLDDNGKMVQIGTTKENLTEIPAKGTDPSGKNDIGNIAVYEFDTNLDTSKEPDNYSISGVEISKFRDVIIDQKWDLLEGMTIPGQKLIAKDREGNNLGEIHLDQGTSTDKRQRRVIIPNVKYWDIDSNGKTSKIDRRVVQEFDNPSITHDGTVYKYNEITNYFQHDDQIYNIFNGLNEVNNETPATITIIKVDSKDADKKLSGAKFALLGTNIDSTTDANGEATFANIKPGTYKLIETKAPEGYKIDNEEKTITVSKEGQVSVSGKNAQFSLGSGKTDIVEHSDYPRWKDFMNTQHYGKIDSNGNLEFYLYLKPYDQRVGGSTDKNTTLNISIPGIDSSNYDVKVYDVNPDQRPTIFDAMNDQNVESFISSLGDNLINKTASGTETITGNANQDNPLTGQKNYQLYFPSSRFGVNWGFLVKVTANIGDKDKTTISYDWLAKDDPQGQSKIRQNVSLSKNSDENGHPTITVTNEEFKKSPIAVTKFADSFDTENNRNRLQGAEFVLKDSEGNILANKFTDDKGVADFGKYPEGVYRLEEKLAPNGYEKRNVYFEVTVDEKDQVTYKAKYENGQGTPVPGEDYYIEKSEESGGSQKATVIKVNQKTSIKEGPGSGSIGDRPGIWEAYRYESLKYDLSVELENSVKGSRFEIQFDPNLDFTQYFKEFPKINVGGKDIADPYFDYDTNLLTYVFNENSSGGKTEFTINLVGMIPSKYYAKNNGTYKITNIVAPGQTVDGNQVDTTDVQAFFDPYDIPKNGSTTTPWQNYYFREVDQDDNGDWYVTAIAYFNPSSINATSKDLAFNWMSTNYQGNTQIARWVGNGTTPAYDLTDVKIYRTPKSSRRVTSDTPNEYMPLSLGIKPEQNTSVYTKVLDLQINPDQSVNYSEGGFTLNYDPNKIDTGSVINKSEPLKLKTPAITNGEGYVIVQTFKVNDIEKFRNTWRVFYMSDNKTALESAFASKVNPNKAKGSQVGGEIPKFYREEVGLINKQYTPASFKITKTNEANGERLKDASFSLTDSNGKIIYRTSGENGEVYFKDLAPGIYTLKEVSPPDKFIGSTEEWQVTVYNDGNIRIEETSITGSGQSYYGTEINLPVTNKPVGEKLTVYKKDGDGKALPGAKFKLTKEDDKNVSYEKVSDPNGIVEFDQTLVAGTYVLEEIVAPEGYNKLDKKWVIVVDANGKNKIYNYTNADDQDKVKSIPGEPGVSWVDVKNRPTEGWESYDNRRTGWTGNSKEAYKLGTRIVAINKTDKYVVQRYIINPEASSIGETVATIHRQFPQSTNMDWYDGDETIRVFSLDKPVTGLISDIRLTDYNVTEITNDSTKLTKGVANTRYGEPQRLKLTFKETNKPILIDVKIPYKDENGMVGTGMDWTQGGTTYWKGDHYDKVAEIVVGEPTQAEAGSIKGSYIGEGSIDVTNELKTYGFKFNKVKEGTADAVSGATFKLTGNNLPDEGIKVRSDDKGKVEFTKLKPGYYTLEESGAARGYQKTDTKWTVTIDKDGKAWIIDKSKENSGTTDTSQAKPVNRAMAYSADSQGLEIGDDLVGNPLRAGSGVTYDILGTISDAGKRFVKVSTGAKYLGNDEFLVRIDVIGNENVNKTDVTFDLQLHDDVTFIKNSTTTWKKNANDRDQAPDNPSRWHTGYDSTTKKIGVDGGFISIDKGDTASMEFKVKMKSGLNIGQVGYIINSLKVYNKDCDKLRAKKFEAYTIHQNAQHGTIITDPLNYQRNGQPVTFTPKANPGYKLVGDVTVTNNKTNRDVPIKNGNEFSMPASDVTINATFEANYYNINKSTTIKNGSVDIKDTARTDEEVSFEVTPESGYKLEKLTYTDQDGKEQTIDVDKLGNGTFTMPPSDTTINATFKKLAYKITLTNKTPEFGSVGKLDEAESGDTVTVPVTPYEEYQLEPIKVTRTDTGAEVQVTGTTFTMPESDVTVEVSFKKKPPQVFNIKVNNGANGTVSVEPTSSIAGETINITVSPDDDYQLDELKVTDESGEEVTVTNNSFTMPKANVTLSATFKEKPITPPKGSTEITDGTFQITNKQIGLGLKVFKTDFRGAKLQGAEFTLEKYDKDYKTKDEKFGTVTGISDAEGLVVFKNNERKTVNLPVGHYKLTETKSPSGYKKAQAPWLVEVYEANGQLKARYKGPKETPGSYLTSDAANDTNTSITADTNGIRTTTNGIKYKSRMTYINTESKTFIQRVYIDTRGYKGDEIVNVQITPVMKREETDIPNQPPTTTKEGVKTAYRSAFKLSGDINENEIDNILRFSNLSNSNVTQLNTARWRPFEWGFDEDQLNLKSGVYYIDIEGFYDDNIKKEDIGKIELNIDFYKGERKFEEAQGRDTQGNIIWEDKGYDGSYQQGNINLGYTSLEQTPTGMLGKTGGRINPSLDEGKIDRITTSHSILPLFSSNTVNEIYQDRMEIENEEETYNITFSKHGLLGDEKVDSEAVTKRRLEGAIFKLQHLVANDWEDVEGSYVGSAFNGYFGFRGLKPDRYRLMEVQAPKGYKPITDPLLYFTVETIKTNSGKIIEPETGEVVDIKSIQVKFKGDSKVYNLNDLYMVDPDDQSKTVAISSQESTKINIEKAQIKKTEDATEATPLNELILVSDDGHEQPISQIKIVPGSSGYISLEYDNANGVVQYIPEKSTSEKDGKLIDFVTSATAKNMGKIINTEPGKGEVTVKKVDKEGKLLPGAIFKLTDLSNNNPTIKPVGTDGTLKFDQLKIGKYRLEEMKSPDGYINTKQIWYLSVGGNELDPYSGPISRTGDDISEKITLVSSEMKVINPDTDGNEPRKDGEIHPHFGESMEFTNKFSIDPDTKINPGDYFVLNMSNQIDLNGIFEYEIQNLDIIEPGVGTIAKADYDRTNRKITYYFTDFAKTYTLVEFSNKLTAFIDLYKVKQSNSGGFLAESEKVGFGIGKDKIINKNIKVVYDLIYGEEEDAFGNNINITSKIVKYDPKTGEFLHYYYINRKGQASDGPIELRYQSDQNIDNLNISYSWLKDNSNVENGMPESFAVEEDSNNLNSFTTVRSLNLPNTRYTSVYMNEGIGTNHSMVVKVTGKVADEDKSQYTADGILLKYNQGYTPTYAYRHDEVRHFKNEASAKTKIEIQAVNPENKILFNKVDQDGKVLAGAKFKLQYKAKDADEWTFVKDENNQDLVKTSTEDGSFEFTKLKPGKYQLIETEAPNGYKIGTNPVAEFVVDKNGRIIRKETIPNPPVGESAEKSVEEFGIAPIFIVNKKEQEIKFKKVDADNQETTLENAEFEVWYKANESDKDYTKLKIYEKTSEGKTERLVLKADETVPKDYKEVNVFTTRTDGKLGFKFYDPGYYALQETKAPKGYGKPRDYVYEFRLVDGKVEIKKTDSQGNVTYEEKTGTESIKIENKKSTFPLTGGNGVFTGFAIIGTAVMLLALAYFGIYQNDKNRRRSARYKK